MAYNVAYRLLGRTDAAADALEEALLTAYRALPALRGARFAVWLLRRVVDACRRRARLGQSGFPPPLGAQMQDGGGFADSEGSPDPDLVQTIEAGIGSLPFESRVVLVLADVQGLSYEEIGQVTGLAPATVGRRLAEGRRRLRNWLYGGGPGTRRALRASAICRET
ncbi:MAG TPA: sigma factor-like helix-turn-helix DNA-binding protein [Anaerolineae bacterium]|nr:sigma factor-like helix-turn-helix DNA-binding protein [Anaerolineae bacterium]HPL29542.1 sigma factor-like helix-turn-helix DNA-binding protein [Anaerolineae bacterium]